MKLFENEAEGHRSRQMLRYNDDVKVVIQKQTGGFSARPFHRPAPSVCSSLCSFVFHLTNSTSTFNIPIFIIQTIFPCMSSDTINYSLLARNSITFPIRSIYMIIKLLPPLFLSRFPLLTSPFFSIKKAS